MERSEGGKAIRRIAEAGEEREMHSRPSQMDAHEQRHRHAEKNAEQSEPQIVEADSLVVGAEYVAGQEAVVWRFRLICVAAVRGHACLGSGWRPGAEPSRRARHK